MKLKNDKQNIASDVLLPSDIPVVESAAPGSDTVDNVNLIMSANNPKFKGDGAVAKPSDKLRWGEGLGSNAAKPVVVYKVKHGDKAAKETRLLNKSGKRADKAADRLDGARAKLEAAAPKKPPGVVAGAADAVVGEAGHAVWAKVHGTIHEAERDNAGVEAAHRAEIIGERSGRSAVRFTKERINSYPERRVGILEKKSVKANARLRFREMARENPELNKNAVNRHIQKQRLKKQYRKKAKEEAAKAAKKTGEKAASATGKIALATARFAKKHPIVSLALALCLIVVITLESCVGGALGIGGSLAGSIVASTYLSDDGDMLAAEEEYAGMEAALRHTVDNYAALNPGYDEYRYDLDEIWHDPYVLISILSAMRDEAWTISDVRGSLSSLFSMQYTLTETVTVEVRYYKDTVILTDPATGEEYEEEVELPYDYYICMVTLKNFNLSHLPIYVMDEEQLSRYAVYMATLGNRPDLFPAYLYPHASTVKEYVRYDIPLEYFGDEAFAALMAEAQKYLGVVYTWGGYSPATGFDCSGFVSYVLNACGWGVGRLTAQGLYNTCTPIPTPDAKPGDLVFFVGTYDTPEISHVGFYVGDNVILHAGNPVGFASIDTVYWRQHLYAYGRLPPRQPGG